MITSTVLMLWLSPVQSMWKIQDSTDILKDTCCRKQYLYLNGSSRNAGAKTIFYMYYIVGASLQSLTPSNLESYRRDVSSEGTTYFISLQMQ